MTRILTLTYGVLCYVIFFLTFLYAIGFLGNVVVPKSLDSTATDHWLTALTIDLGLLSLFALQHSVMARQGFKRLLTGVIPAAAERSTYVLASSVALLLLFWQWRPLGGLVWDVQHEAGRAVLYGGFAFGWMLVLFTTFVINHFDLFGLRQTWRAFRGQPQDTRGGRIVAAQPALGVDRQDAAGDRVEDVLHLGLDLGHLADRVVQRVEEPGVLDRDRGLVREHAQQLAVALGEETGEDAIVDVDHTY